MTQRGHKKSKFNLYQRRFALTLVELLVVIGVISVLTAIILPSVKTILTDRKSSQSAILVRNFFEAARARAIGKNRTVAVVLERVSSRSQLDPTDPFQVKYVSQTASGSITSPDSNFVPYNACIRMSLAEEQLPVTEASFPFQLEIELGTSPPIPLRGVVLKASKKSVSDINLSLMLSEHLIAGNEISVGNSNRRFTIVSPVAPASHHAYYRLPSVPPVALPSDDSLWFGVMNGNVGSDDERALEPATNLGGATTFKIYPKPKPIYSEMVQLPRGMCIDLSLSGFSNETLKNSTAVSPNKQRIYDPVLTPNPTPLSDYRVRFASDWIGNGTAPTPPELRPVYIAFTPDGNLSHVWANERSGANLKRIDATQDIFLHIGKIDQVVMPVDPDPAVLGRNKFAFDALNASGVKQNLSDLNSYVIRLSPKSGSITASPAVSIDTQIGILGLDPTALSLGDMIELSRRGTYSTNVTSQ
jgi:type II secretory pathway pseudopilin PulG